jgi:DNA-binding NtrC family response regulator
VLVQILVVDSDRRCLSLIDRALRPLRGARMVQVPSLSGASKSLEKQSFDLIVTGLELRDGSGMDLFHKAHALGVPIIVASGLFDQATSLTILDYTKARILEKPLDADTLTDMAETLLGFTRVNADAHERAELLASVRKEPPEPAPHSPPVRPWEDAAIIGEAASWKSVLAQVDLVADTHAEVLLLGESGTGKELVAKALHTVSPRAAQAFVAVNCAAIPENLLESELFGHIKGAFTGAVKDRKGRFKEADKGTIFLDEIGEMAVGLQAKLLRVLQEKRFTPVGSDREVSADFRVVAATNVNLESMVQKGMFREDLYHRLYVFPLRLPSLRERRSDIGLLAEHFRLEANAQFRRAVDGFDASVLAALEAFDWPGNVRQLENTIYRLVIIAGQGRIEAKHVPGDLGFDLQATPEVKTSDLSAPPGSSLSGSYAHNLPSGGIELRSLLADIEATYIDQALSRTEGNRNQAARLLGLNRTTLVEKLRKRGI